MLSSLPNKPSVTRAKGFTLVEILIIVPVVILVIGVLVGFLVTLTGDAMMARERSSMVYTTQDALNQIEQDIRISTTFLTTTGPLISPQGSDNGTAAFSSPDQQLILKQYATVGSPYSGTRTLAYYANRPNACNNYHEYNEPVHSRAIYFIADGDLHRRTIIDIDPSATVCGSVVAGIWQVNTCGDTLDRDRCIARDSILASDVSSFSISYYMRPDSVSPTTLTESTRSVTTATVSITQSKEVAGETIEHTNTIRASRLNISHDWSFEP